MRICIVGAGAAGLASARHATDANYGFSCVIFEQTNEIGGTWVYTDKVGLDENGIPVHTSMYKNLRTNLPKELMGFPDFKIPECNESYITQKQLLDFINNYADHFELRSLIKFNHRVKYIEPHKDTWKVTVTNLKEKEDEIFEFDAIMICNGHYHTPRMPEVNGNDEFQGKQIHSHDFRDVKDFEDKNVLVIGGGPSGMDIALQIATTAKKVYWSHHCDTIATTNYPENLKRKPDVTLMTKEEIIFEDKSKETVDIVMYCTGFLYSYPFLDEKSNISVVDNHVQPLYKHLININNPTMCFIGLPFYVCAFSMFDLQARFFLEYLKGSFKLPSKKEMLQELENDIKELYFESSSQKYAHMLGPKQGEYFEKLSSIGKIQPLPPVLIKLFDHVTKRFYEEFSNYRKDVFKIVDDDNFVQVK